MMPAKRKKKTVQGKVERVEFDAEKVLGTGTIKAEDLELDLDSGRYKAMKGQGGDRRG